MTRFTIRMPIRNGVRYFSCKKKRGIFCKPTALILLPELEVGTPVSWLSMCGLLVPLLP